jgi:ATP-dependent exoDNAse (exonuclease V) beta subunit
LREQSITQSPVEIVARVLNYIGIRPIVTAWGPDAIRAAQRQRNLDAFLDLAVAYENHCASQHEAATLTGFLFWLESPTSPELDLQPVVTGGDAVHVLTYHRAKGLEWPVVVATDFHYAWRPRLWDVRAESNAPTLDLDNPLGGRSIRFYPNIFGRNTRGVPVLDAIMASAEAAAAEAANEAEGRRLAYVGMTRARDTVIVAVPPAAAKADAWIRSFECDHLLAAGDALVLPEGEPIASNARDLACAQFAAPAATSFTPAWFLARTPTAFPLRERLSPSEAEPVAGAAAGAIIDVGPRIAVHGNDMASIGTALHAVIAAEFVNPGRDDALEYAAALIEGAASEGTVSPADAVGCARRLAAALAARFAPRRTLVEYPVELVQDNGQVLRGWIDLLLETDAGWVIVDHKSSPRPRPEWAAEAIEYSGQLAAYVRALRGAGLGCAGCWVHFAVGGGLVEVVLGGGDA